MKIAIPLLAFLISYNLYLYKIATQVCDMRIMKLWNYYTLGGLLLVIFYISANTQFERGMILVSKICVLTLITTILLTNHAVISNPYYLLFLFNGSIFANTIIIFICTKRHGFFKD